MNIFTRNRRGVVIGICAIISSSVSAGTLSAASAPETAVDATWRLVDPTEYAGLEQIWEIKGKGAASLPESVSYDPDVNFISFMVRPEVATRWEDGTIISIGSVMLAYTRATDLHGGDYARLVIVRGGVEKGETQPVSATLGFGGKGHFQRVTVRLDNRSQTWDLYVNGTLLQADLPLTERLIAQPFTVVPGAQGAAVVANLAISATNPLFADKNRNGIPDDYELLSAGKQDAADLDGGVRRPQLLTGYKLALEAKLSIPR
jgi:hypothetical protein